MEGPVGSGRAGVSATSLGTSVGHPMEWTVWARDDGMRSGSGSNPGQAAEPIKPTWFKHQGPGDVTLGESEIEVAAEGGKTVTTATFREFGEYVAPLGSQGHDPGHYSMA
jgi:hypothetical protein